MTLPAFRGQWHPQVDEILYKNFFQDKKDGIMIECGSADGLTESNSKFFEELGWTCVNIEPEPNRFKQLKANRSGINNINIDCVLSDKDNEVVKFDVGPNPGNYCEGKSLTYKSLINRLKFNHIDLFVLDVEGHEIKVIEGMHEASLYPTIMCIEYTWVGLDLLDFVMSRLEYKRLFLSYNNVFYLDVNVKDYKKFIKDQYIGATDHWSKLGI